MSLPSAFTLCTIHPFLQQKSNRYFSCRTVVGALFTGQLADMIGRRYTVMIALVLSFAAVTMEFVATTDALFFGGKFLNGFAVGTLQAVSTTYIGEVCSLAPCR